ncbi:MAG: GDSL-type esterase/lipase family protein [Acidithiobacillus ferrivorans]
MDHHKSGAWRLFPVILIAGLLFLLTDSRAVAGKIRVACVGDSITYGDGVPQRHTQGWPGKLQQLLGTGYQVANFGHSGTTMLKNGGLPYWKTAEYKAATSFDPNIVIIMLGTNDANSKSWSRLGSRFTADAEEMIRHFAQLKAHPKIYICTPPPIIHSNYGISEAMLIRGPISDIYTAGHAMNVPVIPVYAELRRFFKTHGADVYYQADGIHPNAAGQKQIAQLIFQFLQRVP